MKNPILKFISQFKAEICFIIILCLSLCIITKILCQRVSNEVIHSTQQSFNNIYDRIENNLISEFKEELKIERLADNYKQQAMDYLLKYNVEHPDIVLRQMIIESANFTSSLFVNYGNPMGMMFPDKRFTTAYDKTPNNFARYASLEIAVIDYKYWQEKNCKGLNCNDYYVYLKKKYAEAPNYIETLKNVKF